MAPDKKHKKEEKEDTKRDDLFSAMQLFSKMECEKPILTDSPYIKAVENKHQKELEALEEAIEKKRNELQAKIDAEHLREKNALENRLEELDHEILAQQYRFQQCEDRVHQAIEKLDRLYDQGIASHEKQMEALEQDQACRTNVVMDKIKMMRREIAKLTPEIGLLDGKLQTARRTIYNPEQAFRIQQGIIDDLHARIQENASIFNREEKQLQQDAKDQDTVLADALDALEQDLEDVKRQLAQMKEPYERQITELKRETQQAQIQPGQIEPERKKLHGDVKRLKDQWKALRGNEEDQLQATLVIKDEKVIQGRDRLLNQRNNFFNERTRLADIMADLNARILDKQRELSFENQHFSEKMHAKEKELSDMEDGHSNKLEERTERRKKRVEEVELLEQEKEKRRHLELNLLGTKEDKLRESFSIKKEHIQGAIDEGKKRIQDLLDELGNPQDKQMVQIQALEQELAEVQRQRKFTSDLRNFVKTVAKREAGLLQEKAYCLKKAYADQCTASQKELNLLQEAKAKMDKNFDRQSILGEEKFTKATYKLNNVTEKMQRYIENLSTEIKRLERKRYLLLDEHKTQEEGIRDVIAKDEAYLESEREKLHEQMEEERADFNEIVDELNEKIEAARAERDDMTTQFNNDIGQFTLKAMGAGGSAQNYSKVLNNLEEKIQYYTQKVEEMDEKLKELLRDQKEEIGRKAKNKRQTIIEMQETCQELEQKLKDKQKLIKEGNKLLKLYTNEDNCLYCRESNQIKGQKEQLGNLHEENRKITSHLTNLFKREKEYERCSSEELGQLKSCLQATNAANEEAILKEETVLKKKLSSLKDENLKLREKSKSKRFQSNHSHVKKK